MEILLHISTAEAGPVARPLAEACRRAGIAWGCFLTNDGVRLLDDAGFAAALGGAARAAVCEHSWQAHMPGRDCPVELGSQTVNSALMAEAAKVVSL